MTLCIILKVKMAVTPSTPRRSTRFISDPVQSPFPYNVSPLTTTSPLSSRRNNNNESLFTSTQIREITTIFQLFNPTVSGYLDIETFELLMLSLAFRVTRQDVVDMVHDITSNNSESESNDGIDLSMTLRILAAKGYATQQRNNSEEEMRLYFRLFDVDDKGYITGEDLKRVQLEAVRLEQEMLNGSESSSSTGNVTDEFVQAIIGKFDVNSTGAIEFEEFRRILHPILS